MRGIIFGALVAIAFACGDSVIEEVQSFTPNTAPSTDRLVINDSTQQLFMEFQGETQTFNKQAQLEPGQVFYLQAFISEKEADLVSISYSAASYANPSQSEFCNTDVSTAHPNLTDVGTFNNQLQSTSFRNEVTASVTYSLPSKSGLMTNSDIYITVTATDAKDAKTNFTRCLGPIKRTPQMTNINGGSTNSNAIQWKADSSGSFIIISKPAGGCAIDYTGNPLLFDYNAGEITIDTAINQAAPLCIVLFDS